MITAPRLDLSTYPDSPYAAELQRDPPAMRFAPDLEAQYRRNRLLDSRTLIRVAAILGVVLTVARGVEEACERIWSPSLWAGIVFVIACSIILASIAWSARF